MKTWTIATTALLALSGAALSTPALAQESLVALAQAGDHEGAMAAIAAPGADVNATSADGSTALLWAAYSVDHALVRALLDAGAKADVTNQYGAAPLTEAIKLGDVEMVRVLLEAGADPDSPNADNQTALMLAANIGSLEIAQLLVEHGADVNAVETFRGQTALMWAASGNYPEIAELLIEHGAEVTLRAKHDDWERQMTSEPRAQFRDTGGLTALLYAARSGCYDCAVAIVEAGADINQPDPDGITPLINALDNQSFDIAMYLIDQGAKVDTWDMSGRTPFYVAVDGSSFVPRGFGPQNFQGFMSTTGGASVPQNFTALDVARRLIDMGVDVNHQLTRMRPNGPGRGRFADYMMRGGTGPLMIATMANDHEAIEMLLEAGAEVDLPNVFQITPLMAAAGMSGSGRGPGGPQGADIQDQVIRTVDLLLDAGADINARVTDSRTRTATLVAYVQGRDHEGETALFAAANMGWDRVVQHLIDRGADPTITDADGDTALDEARGDGPAGPGNSRPQAESDSRNATIALLEGILGAPAGDTASQDL